MVTEIKQAFINISKRTNNKIFKDMGIWGVYEKRGAAG
jgi:hypothetical protein